MKQRQNNPIWVVIMFTALGIGLSNLLDRFMDSVLAIVLGGVIGLTAGIVVALTRKEGFRPPMEFKPGKVRQMIIAGFVHFAAVILVVFLLDMGIPSPWNMVLGVATFLPGIYLVYAMLDGIFNLDEMQSRIQTQGMSFGFMASVIFFLTFTILELAGLPSIPTMFVPLIMVAFWAIGKIIAMRRY